MRNYRLLHFVRNDGGSKAQIRYFVIAFCPSAIARFCVSRIVAIHNLNSKEAFAMELH
ncbi:hypothetical protein [Helicobacter sp.]|uniref:hypothetical protein n=1 Tax=Helicobacter sp. TaxID=218 RepID=UPI0025C4D1B9|nr:hypothetical protein [Helicobacter sp.]MCI5632729.1 hypothetical protein [Helicobacter sp.]MDY5556409.1 hypothetical protein [Helicobacter sp.]